MKKKKITIYTLKGEHFKLGQTPYMTRDEFDVVSTNPDGSLNVKVKPIRVFAHNNYKGEIHKGSVEECKLCK